ncbi:MAG: hypothetical protein EI684_12255 [Candidatus Viridilinea halotolerans]|uniref:Uncharacterized protein n=1 Tax=Candidatus Viridilinea halotolerans TaxID=2491704 RepID=A0A426TYE2_9CHLR|nr:MAG: hypothetical protein EI684_12255 [Candidatus Viridilinea halotolerans]
MFDHSRSIPIWFWGALVALLLILASTRGRFVPINNDLSQVFAAQPTPASMLPGFTLPSLDLANLPEDLQAAARDLMAQLGTGAAGRPVEPRAETVRLRIDVQEVRLVDGGLQIIGSVTNRSNSDLLVPISAFELRDSAGVSYSAGGGASATLKPGESTPLDLSVPLPPGRGLLLITNLPPDPPVEQRLIVTTGS